ncbi:MAG: hypothetical protein OXG43_06135 [Chloroflexi bacterium]|nr:hypothetical protein [Chloroflexota bacterium]
MKLLRQASRHPRLAAWAAMSAVFIALILIVSLGRELDVWQYVGLSAVAIAIAGLSVALTFSRSDDPEFDG